MFQISLFHFISVLFVFPCLCASECAQVRVCAHLYLNRDSNILNSKAVLSFSYKVARYLLSTQFLCRLIIYLHYMCMYFFSSDFLSMSNAPIKALTVTCSRSPSPAAHTQPEQATFHLSPVLFPFLLISYQEQNGFSVHVIS